MSPTERNRKTPAGADGAKGAQAVARALEILKAFEGSESQLAISEIAAACGLTPSTTYRIVRALLSRGFLEQDSRSSRYYLGSSLVALGQLAQLNLGFDRILAVLEQLAETTDESVNFGIPHERSVLVVFRVQSQHPLRFDQPPGSHVPLHASAQGKAFLAFAPERRQILDDLGELPQLTPNTITGRANLETELERIRVRGYSIDDQESIAGVCCVGTAILDNDGRPRATVAIQGPAVRLPLSRLDEVSVLLLNQTKTIADILASDRTPSTW